MRLIILFFLLNSCLSVSQNLSDSLRIATENVIFDLDSIISKEPTAFNYESRAYAKYILKNYEASLEDYNIALDLNQNNNDDTYYRRGIVKEKLKLFKEAIDDFDICIKQNNKYVDAYLSRAYCNSMINNLKESLKDYNHYIEKIQDNVIAYYNRGLVKSKLQLIDEAILDFDKVIILDANHIDAIMSRAVTKAKLGKKDALTDFNTAIKLKPKNADLYLNRAIFYINYNKSGDYCSDLKKAISLGSENAKSILADNCK